ncbi:MOS1T transposase, partial [Pseudoatta argentina]
MSEFIPKKQHLREVLLHYFILKKSAAETHRLLVDIYDEHASSKTSCKEWFRRFNSGDFDVRDKERNDNKGNKWRIIIAYSQEIENTIEMLIEYIQEEEEEYLIVRGDLNVRISNEGGPVTEEENEKRNKSRKSIDKIINKEGRRLIGKIEFSVIDYVIGNDEEEIKRVEKDNRTDLILLEVELIGTYKETRNIVKIGNRKSEEFRIRSNAVKFSSILRHLHERALLTSDIVENTLERDKYITLKTALINRFYFDSEEKRFITKIRVQVTLTVVEDVLLNKLAELADKILEIVNLGLQKTFKWKFCIADVLHPILGADFLSHFGLLIDVKNKRLINNITGLSHYGRISVVNYFTICTTSPNSIYQRLLTKFPKLIRFMAVSIIKNHPIFSSPRRLSPEKLKFAKAEFMFLMEQGICAAPLYMVPKQDDILIASFNEEEHMHHLSRICLLDDASKLLERIIAARIVRHLFRNGPDLSRGQYGFREGLSTDNAIRQGGGGHWRCHIANAFNSMPWGQVVGAMRKYHLLLFYLVAIVENYFRDRQIEFHNKQGLQQRRDTSCGVPQADALLGLMPNLRGPNASVRRAYMHAVLSGAYYGARRLWPVAISKTDCTACNGD